MCLPIQIAKEPYEYIYFRQASHVLRIIFRFRINFAATMYLEVCDKDVFDEFINGPNEKIWEMIDQNQDWDTIADFIEVNF